MTLNTLQAALYSRVTSPSGSISFKRMEIRKRQRTVDPGDVIRIQLLQTPYDSGVSQREVTRVHFRAERTCAFTHHLASTKEKREPRKFVSVLPKIILTTNVTDPVVSRIQLLPYAV